jgi:3-polyprenyl-4-hydroxybenzoate decarboxylase
VRGPEGILSSVKFSKTRGGIELIKREAAIQKKLKHLLILEFRESPLGMFGPKRQLSLKLRERIIGASSSVWKTN